MLALETNLQTGNQAVVVLLVVLVLVAVVVAVISWPPCLPWHAGLWAWMCCRTQRTLQHLRLLQRPWQ
jgi:hypothetical protein